MKYFLLLLSLFSLAVTASADQSVYSDELDSGWQSWSWATVNFANTSPVYSGKYSIAVSETGGYQAIYLHNNPQVTSNYQALVFYINGGTGGQHLQVQATLNGGSQIAYSLPKLAANSWTKVVVPLVGIGASDVPSFDGFWIQGTTSAAEPTYYVDSITLESKPSSLTYQALYDGQLENGWVNTSTASVNLANKAPVEAGALLARFTEAVLVFTQPFSS